jgi:hypothetical protein
LRATQKLAEESLGRFGIAPALHEDVEHVPVLVDRAPKIMQFASNADEHLIQMPFVVRPWPAPFQFVGQQPLEAQTPIADALVADHDAAGGQD